MAKKNRGRKRMINTAFSMLFPTEHFATEEPLNPSIDVASIRRIFKCLVGYLSREQKGKPDRKNIFIFPFLLHFCRQGWSPRDDWLGEPGFHLPLSPASLGHCDPNRARGDRGPRHRSADQWPERDGQVVRPGLCPGTEPATTSAMIKIYND